MCPSWLQPCPAPFHCPHCNQNDLSGAHPCLTPFCGSRVPKHKPMLVSPSGPAPACLCLPLPLPCPDPAMPINCLPGSLSSLALVLCPVLIAHLFLPPRRTPFPDSLLFVPQDRSRVISPPAPGPSLPRHPSGPGVFHPPLFPSVSPKGLFALYQELCLICLWSPSVQHRA